MGDLSANFSKVEFACKCGCGFDTPEPSLLEALERARRVYGAPLYLTSGNRCEAHNNAVGGVPHSAHTRGLGVDVGVAGGRQRWSLVRALLRAGFVGIGVAKGFVHGDVDTTGTLPRPAVWSY